MFDIPYNRLEVKLKTDSATYVNLKMLQNKLFRRAQDIKELAPHLVDKESNIWAFTPKALDIFVYNIIERVYGLPSKYTLVFQFIPGKELVFIEYKDAYVKGPIQILSEKGDRAIKSKVVIVKQRVQKTKRNLLTKNKRG